jgi:hypothetical protein
MKLASASHRLKEPPEKTQYLYLTRSFPPGRKIPKERKRKKVHYEFIICKQLKRRTILCSPPWEIGRSRNQR